MKYLVPPIVIPVLLFIGVVAYGMLRPDYCRPCSGSSSERAATIARSCVRQVLQKAGLVMFGVGGAEPPCNAAPSAPGRRRPWLGELVSLCSFRWSMLR
jgi:hypothetical protein